MILDKRTEFADKVTLPTAAARANVGDVLDVKQARDPGQGQPLYFVLFVSTAVTSAGSANVRFDVTAGAVETPVTDESNVLLSTPAIDKAKLVAGFFFMAPLPMSNEGGLPDGRYLGLQSLNSAVLTAGAISAGLTLDPHGWRAKKEGLN